jgi:uncharacterized membrane protein YhaH (DUF805 family)
MEWYLMVWKKYAQFSGRSRRKELWMFVLFNTLVGCVLCIIPVLLTIEVSKQQSSYTKVLTAKVVRQDLATVVSGIGHIKPKTRNAESPTSMALAAMSVVPVEVMVDETDIVNVQIGQPAQVTVDALPGETFNGHVTLAGDQALVRSTGVATSQPTFGAEEAKDFKVVVTLDNPANELRPGLSCAATITTAHKANVLSLPIQALTIQGPASEAPKTKGSAPTASVSTAVSVKPNLVQGVFVVEEDSSGRLRARFAPVATGITGATDVEVLSGLAEGQEVVTGPFRTLRDLRAGSLLMRDSAKGVPTSRLMLIESGLSVAFFVLFLIYSLAALIPGWAVGARRLHDTGRSGWWCFIALMPFIGDVILTVFWCLDSSPGDNQYGPNPKAA